MKSCLVIGIAGPSAGGKTTVAEKIIDRFGDKVTVVSFDDYYNDLSHLKFEDRVGLNYDHPSAFDNDLLIDHLRKLIEGKKVLKPVYDISQYTRTSEVVEVIPNRIIVVEGVFALLDDNIRDLLDIRIFVETDPDVCFIRRLTRDTKERGRTAESVINQYLETVKPMQEVFIFPTKKYADLVVLNGGLNQVVIEMINTSIEKKLHELKEV